MMNYILIVILITGFGLVFGALLLIEDNLEKMIKILKNIDHKG